MIRKIALAAALAVVTSLPMASIADAGSHHKHKMCKATSLQGKPVTFKCKASQKCCYNKLLNQASCGSKKGPLGVGQNLLCL